LATALGDVSSRTGRDVVVAVVEPVQAASISVMTTAAIALSLRTVPSYSTTAARRDVAPTPVALESSLVTR